MRFGHEVDRPSQDGGGLNCAALPVRETARPALSAKTNMLPEGGSSCPCLAPMSGDGAELPPNRRDEASAFQLKPAARQVRLLRCTAFQPPRKVRPETSFTALDGKRSVSVVLVSEDSRAAADTVTPVAAAEARAG